MPITRIIRALTPTLTAMLLAGCALGEKIGKPDLTLPQAFEAPQSSTPPQAQTIDHWWLLFNDAQLTGLIDQALAASPDAKTALYKLAEARGNRAEFLSQFLPTGDLKGSGAADHTVQKFSNFNLAGQSPAEQQLFTSFLGASAGNSRQYAANFNVSWEIDLFGQDFTAVKTANADLAAARFDYEATRMSLAAEVATDLFQARGLAVQLDDAKENLKLARNLADVAKRKADAGLSTTADAARTESDAESAEATVEAIQAQLTGAQRSLLVLIGKGGAPSSTLPISADISPPPDVPAATPGSLLMRRPDVREAQENLVSAAGRLRLDKIQVFPTFTLQPGEQFTKAVDPIYTTTTTIGVAGVGVTVPIFSIPKLLSEVRAQGARGNQAVAAYEKAVQSAYGDAEKALTTTQADGRRVKLLDSATKRSRFAFDAASKGYDLGLTDLTSLIQAEQSWRQTRATYTSAEISALVDTVATFKALGGGWDAEKAQRKIK
jgi:NodT family efflux transporter outer membrane factor (OMF) lipoprotein